MLDDPFAGLIESAFVKYLENRVVVFASQVQYG